MGLRRSRHEGAEPQTSAGFSLNSLWEVFTVVCFSLEATEEKFRNRESRPEDLQVIAELKDMVSEREALVKKLVVGGAPHRPRLWGPSGVQSPSRRSTGAMLMWRLQRPGGVHTEWCSSRLTLRTSCCDTTTHKFCS